MATLGIDFGTTYTFIVKCGVGKDGKYKYTRIGANDLYSMPTGEFATTDPMKAKGIRTAIGLSNNEEWIVGSRNLKQAIEENRLKRENICWDIKTKLRNINKELLSIDKNTAMNRGLKDGYYLPGMNLAQLSDRIKYGHDFKIGAETKFFDAYELASQFFTNIIKEDEVKDIECIVCGMPSEELHYDAACDRQVYQDNLKSVLRAINTNCKINLIDARLVLRDEPVLASMAYSNTYPKSLEGGEVVLVIDIGGGTSDFAIFKVNKKDKDGNIDATIKASMGGTAPAGKQFDEAIIRQINETFLHGREITIDDDSQEAASNAKEELFPSIFSTRIKQIAVKLLNLESRERKDAEKFELTLEEREEAFKGFEKQGRRTIVEHGSDKYKVVYDNNHRTGLPGDGYEESWADDDKVAEIRSQFEEIYKQIALSISEFLNRAPQEDVEEIKTVLFVGGSSSMSPLRDYICVSGLGYKKENGRYKRGEQNIDVIFFEAEGKAQITCSSAIAVGAAYEADRQVNKNSETTPQSGAYLRMHNTLSIPELYIKFWNKEGEDAEPVSLLSEAKKNKNVDDDENLVYLPLTIEIKKTDVDKGGFVRFSIGRKVADEIIFYPRYKRIRKDGTIAEVTSTFAYHLQFDEEEEELYFFADIINSGEIAVFVCPPCAKSDIGQETYVYRYVFLEKDVVDVEHQRYAFLKENAFDSYDTNLMQVPRKGSKKYSLVPDHKIANKEKITGKRFNIGTYLERREQEKKQDGIRENDNQWYGWLPSNNK